ncbi:hypothetical protein QCA50_006552 [Cerrena zonata]|uniref:WD40 repeat-like protein n=1 Tax=Cerrena zonata TaxID=2478898 RepID=A0AAW0GI39_9APHY
MSINTLTITLVPNASVSTRPVEASASDTSISSLISWNSVHATSNRGDSHSHGKRPEFPSGVALCGANGTLFLFRSRRRPEHIEVTAPPPSDSAQHSRSPSPMIYHGLGIKHARSSSPASPSFAFFQPSKSRVVSGVTTEQAEAPKTSVDYDEEPEKLKDLLKGKSRKDRPSVDLRSLIDTPNTVDSAPSTPRSNRSQKRRSGSRTLLSTTLSAASSISLDSPPSPALPLSVSQHADSITNGSLTLSCHVFSPSPGPSQTITGIQAIHGGCFLACLRRSGYLDILSSEDGSCTAGFNIGSASLPTNKASVFGEVLWTWDSIHTLDLPDKQLILATAIPEPTFTASATDNGDEDEDRTRIVIFELRIPEQVQCDDIGLDIIIDSCIFAKQGTLSWQMISEKLELLYITSGNRLVKRRLALPETPKPVPIIEAPKTSSNVHLPLPNAFKTLMSLSTENLISNSPAANEPDVTKLEEEIEIAHLPLEDPVVGTCIHPITRGWRALVWTPSQLLGIESTGDDFRNLFVHPLSDISFVKWNHPDSFTVLLRERAQLYKLLPVDQNNDFVSIGSFQPPVHHLQPHLIHSATLLPSEAYTITPAGHILSTRIKRGRRRLEHTNFNDSAAQTVSYTLWSAVSSKDTASEPPQISVMLPLEMDDIIAGYSDGLICRSSLRDLVTHSPEGSKMKSDLPLSGAIITLHYISNTRTNQDLLIGGADDGGIAMWDLRTLKLLARWTLFLQPLSKVVVPGDESHLKGCILAISEDGSVAVIALDEYQFLYLIPPSTSSLMKICLGEDNILLYYMDGRARLWDTKTGELWRSLTWPKADELVGGGGWFEWTICNVPSSDHNALPISALPNACRSRDGASTLIVNVETFLVRLGLGVSPQGIKGTIVNANVALPSNAEEVRTIISFLLTPGLDPNIDRICVDLLKVPKHPVNIGIHTQNIATLYADNDSRSVWCISPEVSARRATALIALLQVLLHYEVDSPDVETVITFYTTALGQLVGDSFQSPSLPVLARIWLETPANTLRHAAYLLCEAGIAGVSDDNITRIVDAWHPYLPSQQTEPRSQRLSSAMALFICGHIAISRYTLLPTSQLTDIAKSIAHYLHDELSPYRALAIDLGSLGFAIWQQYVDVVQMLRAFFTLATSIRKETISVHNVGQLARTAVLHIASANTPLFMTTLSMDILQPRNVQHRKSIMQLVVFLIRKKPLILYSNLPRLVEAVVKSLDPNSTASRDAVLDSATEILGHVVQSFPTIDFHMGSQRLAVGTSEGAVIMYDLKTATRLYVLEGHKKRTTACSFSPDGRRLVTLSLEESVVLVWKVGTSFSSFFNPGAPPRQGHGGSEPFKTLNYAIGDDAHMSLLDTFQLVRFEWPAERSVKLRIREATFTFST